MVDMGGIPDRLVQRIGKAQRHQVLDGFLAQIMIDAVDLVFAEVPADRDVQFMRAGKVVADRLFDHQPRALADHAVRVQLLRYVAEDRRPDRQVEGAHPVIIAQQRLEFVPALFGLGINRNVVQALDELLDLPVIAIGFLDVLVQRLTGEVAELVRAHVGARRADDARAADDLAVRSAVVKRRDQLAFGKVAGTAENDIVERIDRNDLAGHGLSGLSLIDG